jgi:hypothetical protein
MDILSTMDMSKRFGGPNNLSKSILPSISWTLRYLKAFLWSHGVWEKFDYSLFSEWHHKKSMVLIINIENTSLLYIRNTYLR